MNTLQKKLAVFLFILSLGLLLSMVKVVKVVVEKDEEIGKLSSEIADFTKKTQDLAARVEDKEKELDKVKVNMEDISYELGEERKKVGSFQTKYKAEKKMRGDLESNLNELKSALEEKTDAKEEFTVEIAKLKEEKGQLLRNLNETKLSKEALEAFVSDVSEGKGEPIPAMTAAAPFITSGRIVTVYSQGLLAVELKKSPLDKVPLGKIVKAQREIRISSIHSHMIILEVDEREDLSGFKKGDIIRYVK